MTSRKKCQTSDAIDFDPPQPNSIEHPPPQTVRTGSLHRMLVAHPLLLLLTTEARRAQRNFIFCRSGDDDRAKEHSPSGRFLRINLDLETFGVLLKELPPKAEALFPGRRLPAGEKTTLSVSSMSLWFISLQCPLLSPLFAN
jgi:hypothetical protein